MARPLFEIITALWKKLFTSCQLHCNGSIFVFHISSSVPIELNIQAVANLFFSSQQYYIEGFFRFLKQCFRKLHSLSFSSFLPPVCIEFFTILINH